MVSISQRKKERINKKVIPHLRKAISYFSKEALDKSEQELFTAVANYRKEHVAVIELTQQFAFLYNNLGAKYAQSHNLGKAFDLFSHSISFSMNPETKQKVYMNLLNTGLLSCNFEKLLSITTDLLSSDDNQFKNFLNQSVLLINRVKNNEPEFLIAGLENRNAFFRQGLPDRVYFPRAFEDIQVNFECNLTLVDHATLDCIFRLSFSNSDANLPTPYQDEPWKTNLPPEMVSKIQNATPNLTIFLTENEHIPLVCI